MRRLLLFLLLGLSSTSTFCADEQQAAKEKKDNTLKYKKPEVQGIAFIAETFESKKDFNDQWTLSQAKKDGVEAAISKYDGQWVIDEPDESALKGDRALILQEKAKHHAVSTMLPKKFDFIDKPLIVQYEVKFQNALECGGAYMKLLSDQPKLDLDEFNDKTPYTIMFGPDKCGEDSKLHFIFRHKNPITGEFEEKHAKKPTGEFSKVFDDKKTHLFTLIVSPDNTFEVRVDKEVVNSGSLLNDFNPAVNPPVEIDDPEDKKPDDWDEREKIVDATAKKPDDWDEDAPMKIADPNAKKPEGWLDDAPENIPDPSAVKPADWDTEEDGEWEPPQIPNPKCSEIGCGEWKPPMIDNPKYKGKWQAPLIANPAYKGIWKPKKIKNPNFFEDKEPFKMTAIAAIGFELWSMTENIIFDNILITNDRSVVDKWTADTWDLKFTQEFSVSDSGSGSLWSALQDAPKERPWLWAVYIAVVLLPIILIFACCFPSKKDEVAEKKKTDEPTEDDAVAQEEEQKDEGEKVQEESKEDEEDGEKNAEEKKEESKAEDTAEQEVASSIAEQEENIEAKEKQNEAPEDHSNSADETHLPTDDQTTELPLMAEDREATELKPEPEQDIPPPDASPRTRASRRKTRKDT